MGRMSRSASEKRAAREEKRTGTGTHQNQIAADQRFLRFPVILTGKLLKRKVVHWLIVNHNTKKTL
jgi:hypothetical protein